MIWVRTTLLLNEVTLQRSSKSNFDAEIEAIILFLEQLLRRVNTFENVLHMNSKHIL